MKMTPTRTIWLIAAFAFLSVACAPIVRNHGYVPLPEDLALLEVGVSSKENVQETIGHPAATNTKYGDDWFYMSNQFEQVGPTEPREVNREMVVVSFNEAEILSNIQSYTLRDGRAVLLTRRVTETNLGRVSFIEQMLKGLGRIDPTSIFEPE